MQLTFPTSSDPLSSGCIRSNCCYTNRYRKKNLQVILLVSPSVNITFNTGALLFNSLLCKTIWDLFRMKGPIKFSMFSFAIESDSHKAAALWSAAVSLFTKAIHTYQLLRHLQKLSHKNGSDNTLTVKQIWEVPCSLLGESCKVVVGGPNQVFKHTISPIVFSGNTPHHQVKHMLRCFAGEGPKW